MTSIVYMLIGAVVISEVLHYMAIVRILRMINEPSGERDTKKPPNVYSRHREVLDKWRGERSVKKG